MSNRLRWYDPDRATFVQINEVIERHLDELRRPGVLAVRPGYEIISGMLTRRPAIVATVTKKAESLPPGYALPQELGGFPVDVRTAGTIDHIRAFDRTRYVAFTLHAQPELLLPTFPYEHVFTGGDESMLMREIAATKPTKSAIQYTPPTGVTLAEVTAPMSLTCHASPDAGWVTLQDFLNGVHETLTIGLYDFTSSHVLLAFKHALEGKSVTLTLDHPIKNPTADQTDEETVAALEKALGSAFRQAWALERMDPLVQSWIYPNAYHIKVAVADGTKFWLSSGNWNNSNQPEIDFAAPKEEIDAIAKESDRDWHVVVDCESLAQTFESYLTHDYDVASAEAAASTAKQSLQLFSALTSTEFVELLAGISVRPRTPHKYFSAVRIPDQGTRDMRIKPLLTPDPVEYAQHVLDLITSATTTCYMQTQYIHPPKQDTDEDFSALIDAFIDLQKKNIDVRIILSQWQLTNDKTGNPVWWERLQQTGLDLRSVRIQHGVHNKGIVVDSKTVMLGSQNWSADGVLRNRDASLIIFDEEVAHYYEQIFLHDWKYMSVAGPLDLTAM
jgi:phosphatidylserine/phosphatidylglycerophosphate/cardiolipin synthase-like enzyme